MNRLETKCLHAGYENAETTTKSHAVPVYRTTAYRFDSTAHASNLFALKEMGNIYTRIMNPTTDTLERRVAALEGGAAALALASGTSAAFYSIINLARKGDEIVSANNLYGGTYTQFNDILPSMGIKVHMVDPLNPENFAMAINGNTKALFCEVMGNPLLDLTDIQAIGNIAHAHGIPLIVDATFSTPALCRPLEHGADIVVHSLTKWMSGHGTIIGGIVVDSGKFDWTTGKHPQLSDPEPSYWNISFANDLGDLAPLAYALRMRLIPLRNLGACIAPDNAWQALQGIETLGLRMERHSRNGLVVARHLQNHSKVNWVRYPTLEGDISRGLAQKYLPDGAGGMVVFGIKGGPVAGQRFIENLNIFSHLANVGDARSLAIHPASTTHSQLSEEQQLRAHITPDLVRLSVGLEHIDDILADIDQALAMIQDGATISAAGLQPQDADQLNALNRTSGKHAVMEATTQFFTYGESEETRLPLRDGTTFGPVTLAYETFGKLSVSKGNAVLIFHALSGSQHVCGCNLGVEGIKERWSEECWTGWWEQFVGPGKAIDTDRFFVVCANYFGGCYGSTGPSSINSKTGKPYGGSFPQISFHDIVDSQLPLFAHLGIKTFHAVIGPSLGGMMALSFATRYPERTSRIVQIACGLKASTLTRVHNLEQILAIENDPNFCNGHYYDGPAPLRGLALARMISHKTFVSLSDMTVRMTDKCEQEKDEFSWYKIRTPLESYILHQGRKFLRRFDANTYLNLIAAWSHFDLPSALGAKHERDIFSDCRHQSYLLFTVDSDCCSYPEEQEHLHQILCMAGVKTQYITVHSEKGHDSFLLEPDLYTPSIKKMLAS